MPKFGINSIVLKGTIAKENAKFIPLDTGNLLIIFRMAFSQWLGPNKDKKGYIDVTLLEKAGTLLENNMLLRGTSVAVTGSLAIDVYEPSPGEKRFKPVITANQIEILKEPKPAESASAPSPSPVYSNVPF